MNLKKILVFFSMLIFGSITAQAASKKNETKKVKNQRYFLLTMVVGTKEVVVVAKVEETLIKEEVVNVISGIKEITDVVVKEKTSTKDVVVNKISGTTETIDMVVKEEETSEEIAIQEEFVVTFLSVEPELQVVLV